MTNRTSDEEDVHSVTTPNTPDLEKSQSLPPSTRHRLKGLDGLRALAIIAVITFHMLHSGQLPKSFWIDLAASRGDFGVRVFFVLSGFLITYLLLNEEMKYGRGNLAKFYIRRGFRILPPALTYLLALLILDRMGVVQTVSTDIVACVLMVRNFTGIGSTTSHFWSLSVEEQFYLIWPCCFIVMSRFFRVFGPITLLALMLLLTQALMWQSGQANYKTCSFYLDFAPLLVGCALATLRATKWGNTTLSARFFRSGPGMLIGMVMVILSLSNMLWPGPILMASRGFFGYVGVALVINHAVQGGSTPFDTVINWPPLMWLGRISYSLYLWQQLFFVSDTATTPRWIFRSPQNICVAFLISVLSYYLVEMPALRMRDRIIKHR